MKFNHALVVVPQGEDEVANFDWDGLFFCTTARGRGSFSVIDESTGIDGKVIARNTFIRGHVEGLVFAEHVTVEKSGYIGGVIFCRTLTIFGAVKANIICDSVYVRGDGRMTATIKYRTLKFDAGADVGGHVERRSTVVAQLASAVSDSQYAG